MTTVTLPRHPADGRISPRAHLRHTGALVRRNLLWIRQDPESMFDAVLFPVVFTLLFVYVFGGSIGQSLGGGREQYVQYIVPGLMAMTGMNLAQGVGTGFNQDFHTGVMDRFRSLPIGRGSVLFAKIAVEPPSCWPWASWSVSTSPTGRGCSPPWACPRCSARP
jgi:oleandomycin transport system permease protein